MPRFDLSACSQLQVFEVRIEFTPTNFHEFILWLTSTMGTITSPEFQRFVLVVEDAHCPRLFARFEERVALRLADQTLWHLWQRTGMKMTVRERILRASFRNDVERAFLLMVSAGALEFELSDPQPPLY